MIGSLLRVGSRTSALAMAQTTLVGEMLVAAWPGLDLHVEPFDTRGDRTLDQPLPAIGGKGLFTAELEAALLAERIDIAVHSLKDLPVEPEPAGHQGLTIGAILPREDVRDVLVARAGATLAALPAGAVVGTSSVRRQAQLLAVRPDLVVRSIRGNVGTRVRKVEEGDYDATLLAAAGLIRAQLIAHATDWLPLAVMLPAPGQGALAVQCRADDTRVLGLLAALDHAPTRAAVTAERTFLDALGGGCSAPIAAFAEASAQPGCTLHLQGLVAARDGSIIVRVAGDGAEPGELGRRLARQALNEGAQELLSHA